jgi:MFS family permease
LTTDLPEAEAPVRAELPKKSPRGFVPGLALSSFGIYLAVLTPTAGGLSAKVQALVGLDDAPTQLGLITGVGALFAFVVQPLAGRLSDRTTSRFGMRRPWILLGIFGAFVGLVICAVASNIPVLLIGWCFTQLMANFAFAAQSATVADQVPEAKRGGVSGIVGAATPIGIVVGAVILASLPSDLLRFLIPGLIGIVLGTFFAVVILKDRVRTEKPTEPLNVRQLFSSFVFNPRKHPDFGWAWLSKLLILLGYSGVLSYLTLFLGAAYGMNVAEQLAFNAGAQVISVLALVIFSVLGGFVSDRLGRRKPFVIAAGFILAAGILGMAVSPAFGAAGLGVIMISMAVLGVGAGLLISVDQALCIAVLPNKNDTAKDLGVLNIANTLPQSVAPFLAGVLIIPLGNALFDGGGYFLWFCVAAAIAIVGSVLVTRIKAVK